MSTYSKDPHARLDYAIDWSAWLPAGDAIETSQWIAPDELTLTDATINDATTIVWISGGAVGRTYAVTNRITTEQGRVDDRTLRITITNR